MHERECVYEHFGKTIQPQQKTLPKDADSDAECEAKNDHLKKVLNTTIYKEDVRIIISNGPLMGTPQKTAPIKTSPKKFGGGGFSRKPGAGMKPVAKKIGAEDGQPIGTEILVELVDVEPENCVLYEAEANLQTEGLDVKILKSETNEKVIDLPHEYAFREKI